ncbi:hypothetical protein BJY52DRAFT_1307099 [Lactarius psammicola]|nr:hypothetical protein BJY52DRAFT_1307099 [Lactarius psammicola]
MVCKRAMAEPSLSINHRTLGRVLYKDWSGLLDSVEFGLLLRNAHYSGDTLAEYYSQCAISIIIARAQEHDERWFELATGHLNIPEATLQNYLTRGDSMLLANCVLICRRTMEDYSKYGWRCDVYSRSKTLQLVSQLNIQETFPELQRKFCDMWNELVRKTRNWRSRNLSIFILKHVRNVYLGLHQGTAVVPTAFSATTSDRDNVLLFPQSYPLCTITHRPAKGPSPEDVPSAPQESTSVASETLSGGQGGVYSPTTPWPTCAASGPPFPQASPCPPSDTVAPPHSSDFRAAPPPFQLKHSPSSCPAPPLPSPLQNLNPVAAPARTPPAISANIGSQCPPPGLSSPEPSSVIQGDSRTQLTSVGPSATPHPYTTPSPPSNPLSRIRDHRTKAASDTSDANLDATTAVHTSSTTAALEIVTPLATHDASLLLTSNAGQTGTISAGMQSVDNRPRISQQCIPVAPPVRAVLQSSPVKDGCRSTGLLADITHGTTSTSASSTASSIPDISAAVSTFPHSLTATSSPIGTVTPRDSGDLQIVPTHTGRDRPQ